MDRRIDYRNADIKNSNGAILSLTVGQLFPWLSGMTLSDWLTSKLLKPPTCFRLMVALSGKFANTSWDWMEQSMYNCEYRSDTMFLVCFLLWHNAPS